ncbi:MAG: LptA/OstA family protein [bacterium]|nr:LptA/OstA family protein [bacterium]
MGKILLLLISIFIISRVNAADISICADNATWDRKEEITTLSGNVLITKGSMTISATKMKVLGKLDTLSEVIGEGKVVVKDIEKNVYFSGGYMKYSKPDEYILMTISPKLELKNNDVVITSMKMEGFYKKNEFVATDSVKITAKETIATASKAIYSDNKKRLELSGNPQVIQGGNKLAGGKIIYYLNEDRFEIIEGVKAILMRR